jgi:hypothetical protein
MAFAKPVAPVLQRGHPLARGLVAAYPFYEGSGGALNDLSGNQNRGALQNSPSWGGGLFGSSLSFNGINQSVSFSGAPVNFQDTSAFSVATWVKTTSTATQALLSTWAFQVNSGWHFEMSDGVAGAVYLILADSPGTGARMARSTATNANDGNWHFVVATYDGSQSTSGMRFYIDGVQSAAVSVVNGAPGALSNSQLQIGHLSAVAPEWFSGQIDGPLIYSRVLSAAEVAQLNFDSFAIYRPPSRWWEVPAAAGAFTNRPGPRMGPAIPFGLAIGGAKLLERNPIMRRRELFRWGDRI